MQALLLALALATGTSASPTGQQGFSDIRRARAGFLVTSADGTIRRVEGDDLPAVYTTRSVLMGLAVSPDGAQVAAVGRGAVAVSRDGGRSFRSDPAGNRINAYTAAFAGKDLLVFAMDGSLWRSRAGGPLERQGTRFPAAPVSALFEDDRRGWVVGEDGLFAATADGGATFTELPGPETPAPWREFVKVEGGGSTLKSPRKTLNGVAVSGGALYLSGTQGVYRSRDGGKSFSLVFENPWIPHPCMRMAVLARSVAVACAGFEAVLFLSTDGGAFQRVPVPGAMHLVAVAFEGEGKLLGVGSHELFVRATTAGGRAVYRSPAALEWLAQAEKLAPGMHPKPGDGLITGVVRNERGGPVEGALVTKTHPGEVHGEGYKEADTGPQGEFQIGTEHYSEFVLTVRKEGFAPLTLQRKPEADGPTRVEITLARPAGVSGVVLGPDGEPLAGARLVLRPPAGASSGGSRASGTAGADGAFELSGLAPGDSEIAVEKEGLAAQVHRVRIPASGLQLRSASGALAGTVVDERGEPIKDISVEVFAPGTFGWQPLGKSATAADGRYAIRGLLPGTYPVTARTDVGARIARRRAGAPVEEAEVCQELTATVAGGEVQLPIRFAAQPAIRGRVEDRAGRRVVGAQVSAQSEGRCPMRETTTGSDGSFTVERPDPVAYRIWALPPGARNGPVHSEVIEARPGDDRLVLVLPGD